MSQLGALRHRLNSLAIQRAVFAAAAVAVAAAAIVYAAAFLLAPLGFLLCSIAVAIVALGTARRALVSAWRMRASAAGTAALADERAGLKGRLTTIAQTAPERRRGALWSFLVEDALTRSDQYRPRAIERRRIDRSIFGLLGAIAAAMLLVPLAAWYRPPAKSALARHGDITLNLDNLQLRPAGPGDSGGLQVEADAATMRRLEDRLAQEGASASAGAAGAGEMNHLLSRARAFAGRMQSRLRGQARSHPRLRLRLAANDPGLEPAHPAGSVPRLGTSQGSRDRTGQFSLPDRNRSSANDLPPMGKVVHGRPRQPEPSAGMNANALANSGNTADENESDLTSNSGSKSGSQHANSAAASHGIGADPGGLFGAPMGSKMSSEGFAISIQARPMKHGANGAGQAYLPPKVTTTLNPNQAPDEPVARAAIPADDRETIQRVFER